MPRKGKGSRVVMGVCEFFEKPHKVPVFAWRRHAGRMGLMAICEKHNERMVVDGFSGYPIVRYAKEG